MNQTAHSRRAMASFSGSRMPGDRPRVRGHNRQPELGDPWVEAGVPVSSANTGMAAVSKVKSAIQSSKSISSPHPLIPGE